jgi:hypothetical protein
VSRAYRRQHCGLTLSCMAAGIAATLLAVAYIIDPPDASERGDQLSTEFGVYVALIGGLLWAVGSGLLAKEPEGDDVIHGLTTATGSALLR